MGGLRKEKSLMRRKPRTETQKKVSGDNASMPKYTIGVVSQLLGLPPQVLRRYEEAGLLEPARQAGKNRLYSDQDIAMLEEIAELSDEGVNAIGIRHIIQIRRRVLILEQEVKEVREALFLAEEEKRRALLEELDLDDSLLEVEENQD
jgi:DNA-binding transcriptional MerR regulator